MSVPDYTQQSISRRRGQFYGEPPAPLLRAVPAATEYPVEALGPLRGVVEAVQGKRLAPVAIPAQSALSMASLAVQGFANVETLGGSSPVSIYALTIALSGERKSSCDRDIMQGLKLYEEDAVSAYASDYQTWKNEQAIWKLQRDEHLKSTKANNADAALAKLEELGPEPEPPSKPDRIVTEPTYEGLVRKFAEGSPSLGIFSDEGGQFLGGYAMQRDNRQRTMSALNSAWHGDPIRRTLKGDGSSVLHNRRLAMHLMVQPDIARDLISNPKNKDIGFLARFLVCMPESTIGHRFQDRIAYDQAAIYAFAKRSAEILAAPMPMRGGDLGLDPRLLRLTPQARTLLVEFCDEIERQQAPGGDLAGLTGSASKAGEQAVRIAGVQTLFADLHAEEIDARSMANGIKIAQYHLSEMLRISIEAAQSKAMSLAESLRSWLEEKHPHDPFVTADIYQNGPIEFRDAEIAKTVLEDLERHRIVERLENDAVVRGRKRKEAWRLIRERTDVV